MFDLKNKKKSVSLKDVDDVVTEWRKTCEERGEIVMGLYGFVSFDPEKAINTEGNTRVFGEHSILIKMLEFFKNDMEDRVKAIRNNKKHGDKHVHA
jgi:hypothetical protein